MFRHRPLLGMVIFAGLLIGIGSWFSLAADPTAQDLYKQGMQKYEQGDHAAALQTLRRVDPMQLSKDDRVSLFETLQDIDRKMHQKASPEDLLKQAASAQAEGKLPQALTMYEEAGRHPQATAAQKDLATARLAEVRRSLAAGETAARQSIDNALADIQAGKLDDAEKKLKAVKVGGLDLGWFDNERMDRALALIASRKPATAAVAAAPAAPKAAEPAKPATPAPAAPVAAAPAKPAEPTKPAATPAPAPVAKAAEPVKPVAAAPAPMTPVVVEKPVYVAPVVEAPKPVAPAAPVAPAPAAAKPATPAPAPTATTAAATKPAATTPAASTAAPMTPVATVTPAPAPVKPAAPAPVAKPVEPVKVAQAPKPVTPAAPAPQPVVTEKAPVVAPMVEVKPAPAPIPTGPAPAAVKPPEPVKVAEAPKPAAPTVEAPKPVEVKPAPAPATPVAAAPAKPVEPAKPVDQPKVVEVQPVAAAPAKPVEAPKADPDLLAQAKTLFVQQKLAEGRAAEAQGNLRVAIRAYEDGLSVDAGNKDLLAASQNAQAALKAAESPRTLLDTQVASQQLIADATVAEFNAAMNRADQLLKDNNFAAAAEAVQTAKLTIDRQQNILPAATYDRLRKTATDQASKIARSQTVYEAQQRDLVSRQRATEQEESRRRVLRDQEEEIQRLLRRAAELRREQKYEKALEALNQALFLDPNHVAAQAMKEMIEDTSLYVSVREDERRRARAIAKHQAENMEATIPYTELLTYPADWPELTYRRLRSIDDASYDTEADREVSRILNERKLDRVEFDNNRLSSVIDYLRTVTGLNIFPNWTALQQAGVDQDRPVTLQLVGVSAETILTRVLEQVTIDDNNPVIYTVDNGVVVITAQRALQVDRDPLEIYDIADLMHIVPDNRVLDYTSIGGDLGGDAGLEIDVETVGEVLDADEIRERRLELATALTQLIVENVGRPADWWLNNGPGTLRIDDNSKLIVRTSSRNHKQLKSLLDKLRRGYGIQITVESRFLAVTQNFLDEFGLGMQIAYDPPGDWGPITVDTRGTQSIADRQATPVPNSFGQVAGSTFTRGLSMGFSYLDDLQLDVLLRATQARRNVTTLNAPRVTFLNGKNAQINIYRSVAFIGDLSPVSGAAGFDADVEQAVEGVFLEVEGAVSPDRRYVTMNVYPKLAELIRPFRTFPLLAVVTIGTGDFERAVEIEGVIELPEARITEVRTSVVVPDRGTLLLGGQRLVGDAEIEAGVPILSKIPVVNRFFTNSSTVKDEQILLILLRPSIIIPEQEEDTLFPGLREDPARYNVGRGLGTTNRTYGISGTQDRR